MSALRRSLLGWLCRFFEGDPVLPETGKRDDDMEVKDVGGVDPNQKGDVGFPPPGKKGWLQRLRSWLRRLCQEAGRR